MKLDKKCEIGEMSNKCQPKDSKKATYIRRWRVSNRLKWLCFNAITICCSARNVVKLKNALWIWKFREYGHWKCNFEAV